MAFRTKKISQMDPKGSNLASTDLLEISQLVSGSYVTKSITGAEIISGATTGFVPTTRTLTINGTTQDLSADRTFTISTGITIGTTAITSGTVGRVLFEGTGNVVQESANLFWDNTNGRLGIGTSSPTKTLDSRNGFSLYSGGVSANGYYLESTSATSTDGTLNFARVTGATGTTRLTFQGLELNTNTNSGVNQLLATSGQSWAILTNGSEKMRVLTNGNVLINTTTDAGFKLDVNGNTRSARFYATDGITVGRLSFDGFNNNTGIDYNSTTGLFRLFAAAGLNFLSAGFNLDTIIQPVRNTVDNIGDVVINVGASERARFKAIGNIGFGTASPNASSLLDLTSTTRGFLPPRMTTTQKNAIATPATGLMVYDTTLNLISVYNGTTWITL